MNLYLGGVLIVMAALAQTSVMPGFLRGMRIPDMALIVAVSWTLLRGRGEGMVMALGSGLLLDLLSGGPFGILTISFLVADLLVSTPPLGAFRGSSWLPLVATMAATTACHAISFLALAAVGRPTVFAALLQSLAVLIPANAVMALCVYWLLARLERGSSDDILAAQS